LLLWSWSHEHHTPALWLLSLCSAAVLAEEASTSKDESGENKMFSVTALFICFREALEGCVIMSLLLNMLHKTGFEMYKKWVWIGAIAGIVAFVLVGAIFISVFYAIKSAVPDAFMYVFEGLLALFASCILTALGLNFLRMKDLERKWTENLFQGRESLPEIPQDVGYLKRKYLELKAKLSIKNQAIDDEAKKQGLTWSMVFFITFSSIFREGVETVFMLLFVNSDPAGLAIGGIVGIVCGIVFGIMVLLVGRYFLVDISTFFHLTTIFILFIAAGLARYFIHEFEELGEVRAKTTNDPIILRPLYDLTASWGPGWSQNSGWGAIAKALVGYTHKPTMLEGLCWLGYWELIIMVMLLRYKRGTLFSKYVAGREESSSSVGSGDAKVRRDQLAV